MPDQRSKLKLEVLNGNAVTWRLWGASPVDMSEVINALIAKRQRRLVSPEKVAAQLRVHFPAMIDAWLAQPSDGSPAIASGRWTKSAALSRRGGGLSRGGVNGERTLVVRGMIRSSSSLELYGQRTN